MRVFVTGATGFIGSALTKELIAAGHQVVGLTRSDAGADALKALGAQPLRGSLEDPAGLAAAAADADAVAHLAFNHDFSRYVQNCEDDRRVIEALGTALAGSGKTLVVTSGTSMANTVPGEPAKEMNPVLPSSVIPRAASEEAADAVAARGVNVAIVRLPQVHDTTRFGLISPAIDLAIQKGVAAYLGDGQSRWTAAHVLDVARLYRLALEKAAPHARYHAVAEGAVRQRDIAEAIGRRLKLPVVSIDPDKADEHFGWLAFFMRFDTPASSAWTRDQLAWHPTGPTLLEDLANLERS